MTMFENTKREYMDKCAEREAMVAKMESHRSAGEKDAYNEMKGKVLNINEAIDELKFSMAEQERKMDTYQPSAAEARDEAEERGAQLLKGDQVVFTQQELRRGIRNIARVDNSITLATGTLAEPTGVGGAINDSLGSAVSAIIDQVSVEDLTGMGSLLEMYEISPLSATGGNVKANAGKARAESTGPVFGKAKIAPYELTVTSYVDRNINRLTPIAVYQHVYGKAMRAMRYETCKLIVNGDGQSSPDMYGITTAKNTDNANIFASLDSLAKDAEIFDNLYFAYGGDEVMGFGARVFLTKSTLHTLAKMRNANMERVFKISYDTASPSTGVIDDGGSKIPFTLIPGTGTQIMYGDPMNYKLGLFGEYSVRLDESIMGKERMLTILGDAFVGGNLTVDKGMVVGTLAEG